MKLMTVMLAAAAGTAAAGVVEVRPGGNTPADALRIVREAKRAGDKSAWTVKVHAGTYPLKEPLVFLPEDSGTAEAPVRWIGEGEAVISGGEEIAGWTVESDGTWSAPLPSAPGGGKAYFDQLWVNGRRADRARFPDGGQGTNSYFLAIDPEIRPVADAAGKTNWVERVRMPADAAAKLSQLPAGDLAHVQLGIIHKWSFARRIVRGFDAATGIVETHSDRTPHRWGYWNGKATILFLENVRSAFDAPGEWFYDAAAGKVRYRPLPGETPQTVRIVAPSSQLSRLVEFRGEPDRDRLVRHVEFENLVFAHSASTGSEASGPVESWQHQAAIHSDGTVMLDGVRNLRWNRCKFRHTGNYAMKFNDGCVSNRVENSLMEDLGAGGVWMGSREGAWPEGTEPYRGIVRKTGPRHTAFNVIDNCIIRRAGRYNPEATAVALTHVSDSKVTHCVINDIYYTGVSVGWTWGYKGSTAQRNEISYNRIWDLGKGIMSDMGGVYTLATSFGTRVFNNIIHDVNSYSYGGWALYTDEGSEGIVMERNLCWNTTDAGFHQHFGTGCIIRNNIFAWNRTKGAVSVTRAEFENVPSTLYVVNNIVLVREGELVNKAVHNTGGVWAGNLWWDVSGNAKFGGGDWEEWVRSGKEIGGIYADPKFANPEGGDFRLRIDSPVFKPGFGFRPWDYSLSGLRQ